MEITYEEVVRAPAERVFALVSDVEAQSQWLEGLSESTYLDPGERGVGARFRQTYQGQPRQGQVTRVAPLVAGNVYEVYR